MQLNRIDDPRDSLSKARRSELIAYARANGVKEIDPNMPAILMREILRGKGLTRIKIPNRPLGAIGQTGALPDHPLTSGVEADATADLARQWAQQSAPAPAAPAAAPATSARDKPLADMGINELRKVCQDLGIKLGRTDNMKSMREHIEAHRNGQNAA